ncbi:hypothetical protein EUGRSUZ_F00247 [Eucalyptus grandis]|uniref:Uncharacterized protein n=2 Tax=Eucalyptus grandis TaxID=71139 RepID=A0ACC3KCD8_EUCGR|nr:hypothetical protein EUGRSUZ_F00247 [Eucalyptus grandis]
MKPVTLPFRLHDLPTHTSTLPHPSPAKLGAPSAIGLTHGSSLSGLDGQTKGHSQSTSALLLGGSASDPIGVEPQKKGWTSATPRSRMFSLSSGSPAAIAVL